MSPVPFFIALFPLLCQMNARSRPKRHNVLWASLLQLKGVIVMTFGWDQLAVSDGRDHFRHHVAVVVMSPK